MIQEISIANKASYSSSGEVLSALKAINFIFGMNGVGKTTISRVVNDPDLYTSCGLTWERGHRLPCLVYNKDFVERSYAPQLAGIFTLGESAKETLDQIEAAKTKVREFEQSVLQLSTTLGMDHASGKRGELNHSALSSKRTAGR